MHEITFSQAVNLEPYTSQMIWIERDVTITADKLIKSLSKIHILPSELRL
jgi:hypothetical protein